MDAEDTAVEEESTQFDAAESGDLDELEGF